MRNPFSSYIPTYLPTYLLCTYLRDLSFKGRVIKGPIFVHDKVTKMKPDINWVGDVHPQNWVITGFQWMVRQWRWVYSKPCQRDTRRKKCSHMYISVLQLVSYSLGTSSSSSSSSTVYTCVNNSPKYMYLKTLSESQIWSQYIYIYIHAFRWPACNWRKFQPILLTQLRWESRTGFGWVVTEHTLIFWTLILYLLIYLLMKVVCFVL